ncbi:hypothetical protein Q4543_18225 [Salipiger sp. 1_MG-2023]|uniref:hypothetical protein n=1 Tax=Salipiger sp. 1_MG-2023 TaxID=3062665 RepID=UPI0026E181F1|nr:hypothetical protein [Salipiger sp. 1_MG-2023]MDO6587453.1 hypothetical protein [Salipiger sp. 1_MG-2023]
MTPNVLATAVLALGAFALPVISRPVGATTFHNSLSRNTHTANTVASTAASLAGLDTVLPHRAGSGSAELIGFVANGSRRNTQWNVANRALNTANLLDADPGPHA